MKKTQKILLALNFLSKKAEAMITQNLLVSLSCAEAKKVQIGKEKKKRKEDIYHETKFQHHAYFSLRSSTKVSRREEQQRFKMQPSTG